MRRILLGCAALGLAAACAHDAPLSAAALEACVTSPEAAAYFEDLHDRVYQHWPDSVRGNHVAKVSLRLLPSGAVDALAPAESTDPLLTEAVLAAVREAAPFPPLE